MIKVLCVCFFSLNFSYGDFFSHGIHGNAVASPACLAEFVSLPQIAQITLIFCHFFVTAERPLVWI